MALNNNASIVATACCDKCEVKLWDVKQGVSTSFVDIRVFMHTGTLLQGMTFQDPRAALFFHHDSNKLIVACKDNIFIVIMSTQSTQPFSSTPQDSFYYPHALTLSNEDSVLVAGCSTTGSVCGYDTASLERLWICNTDSAVCAVCMLGAHVLVTLHRNPASLLDRDTGAYIASLQKAEGSIFGLGVIEGLRFNSFLSLLITSDLHISVYLAMLQHLLYKKAKSLHLPLEMWDWIAKYRV